MENLYTRRSVIKMGAVAAASIGVLGLTGCGGSSASSTATFKILDEHLDSEHYGVGFLKGNTTLRDDVEKALIAMNDDGTVQTICDEFADQGINYDEFLLGKDGNATSKLGDTSDKSSSVTQGVGDDNTLTVGFDQNFPPYGYMGDDGQYTGFDLKLAAEVASRNGWSIAYLPINWDAKELELESGSIDCIWNGFTIEGRENDYTWTDPYMDNSQVVVVRGDSGIASLDDLSGKVVMVQADSAAYYLFVDDNGEAGAQMDLAKTFKDLKSSPDYNTAFQELESGAVDAVAIDLPVAKFEIAGREA